MMINKDNFSGLIGGSIMKRLYCLVAALLMLMISTAASSENITELFADFEHLHVATESEACMVKPSAKALTAYATDHNFCVRPGGR